MSGRANTRRVAAQRHAVVLEAPTGSLLASRPFGLGPHASPGAERVTTLVPGSAGTITVTHDGGYGVLAGKAVAIEPATGVSFDTPLTVRPR